ncbi:immune inhibitor A domain-containing protein [Pimelobacter simplex]|uniref:immune inhibitor A domain-containing protein n=1 Tax=Nocardioides simplex TaxID=2045 RepID=UPI001933A721|nr:immune inhibitor A [Pimelobacter simplex]
MGYVTAPDNEIPEPDRSVDNSTYWVPDFDKAHYDEMFMGDGESFRDYYRQVSGGRYDVSVTTEDWVTVPGNAASYGDNAVEPENGGLGVFAHEYGHDLELPDYYDTANGENGTGFWTLMSSGSWLGHGLSDIGTTPGLMGPEEKLFLGWLDHSEVSAGHSGSYRLSPSQETAVGQDQAVKVDLPDKTTTTTYTAAATGEHAWYSGRGDNLVTTLTRQVPAGSRITVGAKVWNQIETDYDYLYAEYSLDDGASWTTLDAITGSSGWAAHRWAYGANGAASLFRFRYATDGGVDEAGAFIDDITLTNDKATFADGAENGDNGWSVDGFKVSTGTETKTTGRYYLLENRQYVGYDATLRTGPYQFSEGVTRPD